MKQRVVFRYVGWFHNAIIPTAPKMLLKPFLWMKFLVHDVGEKADTASLSNRPDSDNALSTAVPVIPCFDVLRANSLKTLMHWGGIPIYCAKGHDGYLEFVRLPAPRCPGHKWV